MCKTSCKVVLASLLLSSVLIPSCTEETTVTNYAGGFTCQVELENTSNFPRVSKIIARFDSEFDPNQNFENVFSLKTDGSAADTTGIYLSDSEGNEVSTSSRYLTIDTDVDSTSEVMKISTTSALLPTVWKTRYVVSLELNEGSSILMDGEEITSLSVSYDAINSMHSDESDKFEKDSFTYGDITLQTALYTPEGAQSDNSSNPLMIWFHGAGEGGDDIDLALLSYDTSALAGDTIQSYFRDENTSGAYVLLLQTETMWLDTGDEDTSSLENGQDCMYTEAVHEAISNVLENNPDIDSKRVYLSGCSNGGFMTMKLAETYGNEYAAYAPICEAYEDRYLSDEKIEEMKDLNIYFIHSEDDTTVPIKSHSLPTYYRLINAGAENVHYSMQTGYGHSVWPLFFQDGINTDFDAEKVKEDYANVTIEDGTVTSENCYVTYANCTENTGSVFAWLSDQVSA